jgi:hypothetical protein
MPVLIYRHPLQLTYNYAIFVIMKNTRRNKYEVVNDLPTDAMRVSEYAIVRDCNTSYIYELIRTGKNTDFKIVVYKGINFVLINK